MSEENQIYEILKIVCTRYANGICSVDGKPCEEISNCEHRRIANRLYNADCRKQEWISVKDDTPKDGEKRVQVFLRDDAFTKPIGSNKIDTDRYIDGKWVRWGKHVTHWMELPAPPKGVQT